MTDADFKIQCEARLNLMRNAAAACARTHRETRGWLYSRERHWTIKMLSLRAYWRAERLSFQLPEHGRRWAP